MGLLLMWHPCGTRDTLVKRVPALYTKAMWHPCTLKTKKSPVCDLTKKEPDTCITHFRSSILRGTKIFKNLPKITLRLFVLCL